jgi:polyhydroxyalkanoate depolymerase
MLYQLYQAHDLLLSPLRAASGITASWIELAPPALRLSVPFSRMSAAGQALAGARLTHSRPDYGIDDILLDGETVPVEQSVADATPFGSLVRFRRAGAAEQPRVLLIAPLSGHFSTLMSPTVRTLLNDHEVYLAEWHNARDVGQADGCFDLDDYVDHVIRFLRVVGPGANVMAVCQPCGPALVAAAVLAADNDPVQPRTLTLMSGPIDTDVNPAEINVVARSKPLDWYRRNCLTVVPPAYRGAGRQVYPGFLQVTAFMSMNVERHMRSYLQMYRHLSLGQAEPAARTQQFYAEYFAVLDMPAEFYIDTIDRVFQRNLLAHGEMTYRGEAVRPAAITRTALLTVEAEKDDLCPVGQTVAAQALASGLTPEQRQHYIQPDVGHYGVFAGRRWDGEVYPVVRDFIRTHGR